MSAGKDTNTTVDGYTLRRTYVSSTRLNAQHYLWRDCCGYNIHPDIPIKKDDSWRIADVGTGTGIWAVDVHRQYPNAQIDGFDVSLAQCPSAAWLPSKLSLRKLNVFDPLPEELEGVYDLVHVRLFLVVILEDPVPVLRNLMKMLKPGGYIQWGEHNMSTISVVSVPGCKDSSMQQLVRMMKDTKLGLWVPGLSKTFTEQGLLGAKTSYHPTSPEERAYWTQMQFNSNEDYSILGMDNDGPDAAGPKYRKLIQEATEELRDGAAMNYVLEVTIGRKAAE